jgi:hypothetical protein
MKKRNQLLKYNLQYFADDNGNADQDGADNSGDGDDDQDDADQDDNDADDKSKKSDKKGKYLTQDEINQIIEERLKRERKKLQKQQQPKDDKQNDKGSDDNSKDDANTKKLSELEMKVLCYDHDVSKEFVKEAIAIAKAYVDEDTDMDEALDLVTKKFPQFVKGSGKKKSDDPYDEDDNTDNKKSWGQRQKGSSKKIDPVEARFLEKNPGLKID